MAKLILILSLMGAYLTGVHILNARALAATQQMTTLYTAANHPDQLLATWSK